jgi:hypothetical protein
MITFFKSTALSAAVSATNELISCPKADRVSIMAMLVIINLIVS